jgi:hypothetical protein
MARILDKPSVRYAALPISVEQYHRLNREGIIGERTELLRGVIIERVTKSTGNRRMLVMRASSGSTNRQHD